MDLVGSERVDKSGLFFIVHIYFDFFTVKPAFIMLIVVLFCAVFSYLIFNFLLVSLSSSLFIVLNHVGLFP